MVLELDEFKVRMLEESESVVPIFRFIDDTFQKGPGNSLGSA